MSAMNKKIRALVVDDSAYNRTVIGEMLASDAGIEFVLMFCLGLFWL